MTLNNFNKNQRRWFWVLHLGGWAFWGLFVKYLYTTQIAKEQIPWYFVYVMVITVIGILITLGLRYVYRWVIGKPIWAQVIALGGGRLPTPASRTVRMSVCGRKTTSVARRQRERSSGGSSGVGSVREATCPSSWAGTSTPSRTPPRSSWSSAS